jgi:hypothetical protein
MPHKKPATGLNIEKPAMPVKNRSPGNPEEYTRYMTDRSEHVLYCKLFCFYTKRKRMLQVLHALLFCPLETNVCIKQNAFSSKLIRT